jgi:hypothetical protein
MHSTGSEKAARDNVDLLVDTKARIQAIVEREWSATRRTRSRQILARWLDQQGSPGVLALAKHADQAFKEATQPALASGGRRRQTAPIHRLPLAGAPGNARVAKPSAITPADHSRSIRRRLFTVRAAFEVIYAQDEVDAADG